jgi:hypothetical protein
MNTQDKIIPFGTNQDTTRVIVTHLRAWLYDAKYPDLMDIVPDASVYLKNAIKEQNKFDGINGLTVE